MTAARILASAKLRMGAACRTEIAEEPPLTIRTPRGPWEHPAITKRKLRMIKFFMGEF